jgi:hypothetical protein
MTALSELLTSGRFFDLVLGMIALEILILLGYRLFRNEHLVAADVYPNLIAAAGLLGAARAVMAGAWWGYVALLMSVALVGHVLALRMRWRARRSAGTTVTYYNGVPRIETIRR